MEYNAETGNLRKEIEHLVQVNKDQESYIHKINHDLRAPLICIGEYSKLLLNSQKDKLDAEGINFLERIGRCADRANRILADSLKLLEISTTKNQAQDVSVREIIDSLLADFDSEIKERAIDVSIKDPLPVLYCDPARIRDVFSNLVSNAIKYSIHESVGTPAIEIGYTEKDEDHEFYVKDNGIGIDAPYHEKIFELFFRLNPHENGNGTGMGLHIVKKIIADHGGSIWLQSASGKGSTFYFTVKKQLSTNHTQINTLAFSQK